MKLKFQEWLFEYIDHEIKQKDNEKNLPWKDFKVHEFISYLRKLVESDNKKITRDWAEELGWLEQGEPFEVNVNPFGSLRITCRKTINDIQGEKIRVCKYVYAINDEKINIEKNLAESIYEKIKKISSKNIDYPAKHYNLQRLATELYDSVAREYPSYIMFPTKLRKMNDDYYKVVFEFKGQGVGVPGSSIAMQFNIDLAWDKEKGLIKCWGYNIDSPSAKRQFNIQPSEWYEYFSPKEKRSNIIKMISTTLMTY